MKTTKTTTFCSMVCNYSVQENRDVTIGNKITLTMTSSITQV